MACTHSNSRFGFGTLLGAGMRPGIEFIFENEGDDAPGHVPGDVRVTLVAEPHVRFIWAGDDLATQVRQFMHTVMAKICIRSARMMFACVISSQSVRPPALPVCHFPRLVPFSFLPCLDCSLNSSTTVQSSLLLLLVMRVLQLALRHVHTPPHVAKQALSSDSAGKHTACFGAAGRHAWGGADYHRRADAAGSA